MSFNNKLKVFVFSKMVSWMFDLLGTRIWAKHANATLLVWLA